jgi:hypothetical protein
MTIINRTKLSTTARQHFLSRAKESIVLAAMPGFRFRRRQYLALAERYQSLAEEWQAPKPPASLERRKVAFGSGLGRNERSPR